MNLTKRIGYFSNSSVVKANEKMIREKPKVRKNYGVGICIKLKTPWSHTYRRITRAELSEVYKKALNKTK
jgi:uncharacterized protein YabN with tetrapyrrole methylase and pyrophosphatase domain